MGLRATSKTGYISHLETLRAEHGHRTVAGLSRERIITGILQPYAIALVRHSILRRSFGS